MPRIWDEVTRSNDTDALLKEILERIKVQNSLDNKLVDHIIWTDTVKLGFD
jgi:hypothetical protein